MMDHIEFSIQKTSTSTRWASRLCMEMSPSTRSKGAVETSQVILPHWKKGIFFAVWGSFEEHQKRVLQAQKD